MTKIRFPARVLAPLTHFLKREEKRLEKQKKALEAEDPFSDPARVNDNAASDADAAEEVGHERVAALKKEVDKRLISIRKALTRIKIGKYGLCVGCGRMIDTDRLAVNPTAEYCIECERKRAEKR